MYKSKTLQKIHETWHGVMTCMAHMYPGKIISNLGQILAQAPHKPELLTGSFCGFDMEHVTFCGQIDIRCTFSSWTIYFQRQHIPKWVSFQNMKVYMVRLGFLYINWLLYALFNVHNSSLNYIHKVRSIKIGWNPYKCTCIFRIPCNIWEWISNISQSWLGHTNIEKHGF